MQPAAFTRHSSRRRLAIGLGLSTLVLLGAASLAQAGEPLGTRSFTQGGDSRLFITFLGGIALGPFEGALVLDAGAPDAQGVAPVSGEGLIHVDILGGSQGRSCRRFEDCTGQLFCDGGFNVDVTSLLDSEGCQGKVGGSGNAPDITTMVNPTDSGPGALLLHCMVSEATFRDAANRPDCASVPDGDGVESYGPPREFVLTTGVSNALEINACDTQPPPSATGENFDCAAWTEAGTGTLVHTRYIEEQDELVLDRDIGEFSVFDDDPLLCGNGEQDPAERCDDGGESETCDADCSFASCGDGVTNASAGEECEADAACGAALVCSSLCACIPEPVCGNGVAEDREDCDDQGESAACDADCSAARCGDGLLNGSAGEDCEATSDCLGGEVCTPSCGCAPALVCGNGALEPGEECDDGNLDGSDGCDAVCLAELPFRVTVGNLNLLHAIFEDNDIEDRLALAADEIAAFAPDIVTLQEVAFVGGRDAHEILIEELATRHGLGYGGLKYGEPAAGQAVLSRWPLELRETELLPSEKRVPEFSDRRFVARVVVNAPVGPLDVYALHFCAGSVGCSMDERVVQTGEVVDFLARTHSSRHPAILGADFNAHFGSPPDAEPLADPPVALLLDAGLTPLFDGFDAPCSPPLDRSGCTSSQELRAESATTSRRIDNILVGAPTLVSRAEEVGPTATFAAGALLDPSPRCVLEPPQPCILSSECPEGDLCSTQNGICQPQGTCSGDPECGDGAFCETGLWVSDHIGVRTAFDLVRVPEPAGWLQALTALLAVAGLRSLTRPGTA